MKFSTATAQGDEPERDTVFLSRSHWDDWFQFATLHTVTYVDPQGQMHYLGEVKIGRVGLLPGKQGEEAPGRRSPELPATFESLTPDYFSVGQDDSFYERLSDISAEFREQVLGGLRDIAFDSHAREVALTEKVTSVSLLRSVTMRTVEEQFARMAHGGARLTPYSFSFKWGDAKGQTAGFDVKPESRPPTNLHVIIGRNGVGKSRFLSQWGRLLVARSREEGASGPWDQLANVVIVSFSAFDEFVPMRAPRDRTRGLGYKYVGLKKVAPREGDSTIKDDRAINTEMTKSLLVCLSSVARRERLRNALGLLEHDPIFAEAGLAEILQESPSTWLAPDSATDVVGGDSESDQDAISRFGTAFRRLSSGHKIVLLSITRLVETVEERTLVLLDEPEGHLHPPLLSAFVRALSDLLTNRNGMAIIATHSPVVLQEVPRNCVWKLRRTGTELYVDRPRLETFGENVGILTDEVFGLEVTSTGFHRMLADAAMSSATYEEALASFDGSLGSEGRSILRAMMLPSTLSAQTPRHVGG